MPGGLIRMSEYVPRPRQWLWPERIPLRALTMLDGDPGTSKSTLTCDVAARLTRGRRMYGSEASLPAGDVILMQGEDDLDATLDRLRGGNADLARIHVLPRETTGPVHLAR